MTFRFSNQAVKTINYSIYGVVTFWGLFSSSPTEFYSIWFELFLYLEMYVLSMSGVMMIIGQIFGERIQVNKHWELSAIMKEIIGTSQCFYFVAFLATFPVLKYRKGEEIGITLDFDEATNMVDNIILKYIFLIVKQIFIWLAAAGWTYLKHYSLHRPSLFAFHKHHHSCYNPTAFAAFCVTPVHTIWTFCTVIVFCWAELPGGKLYYPFQVVSMFGFLIQNLYMHCGYTISVIERTLPYVYINTSAYHNVHHEKTHTNLGEVSPFWDYVFGTYDKPKYLKAKKKFNWTFYDFSS